jgi:magnesium-transporting ATPase (P-type)
VDLKSYLNIWRPASNLSKLNHNVLKYFYNKKNLALKPSTIKSLFLVPGDVIYLDTYNKVPCDCLVLDGHCSVLESYLTGESNNILKEALSRDKFQFRFECAKKSILFQGSEIIECESNLKENGIYYIKCLVINTGYNTYWGSFLQNILFPKKMNFKFYHEFRIFLYFMIMIYVITVGLLSYSFVSKQSKIKKDLQGEELEKFSANENAKYFSFFLKCLDLLTVIIPPGLHICMNVISVYFNETLKKKQITCLSEKRLNAAGKVNTIVLDKTGTLTTDGLEVSGFQSTTCKERIDIGNSACAGMEGLEYDFSVVEKSPGIFNSMHKEFWMRYAIDNRNDFYKDYEVNVRNNPVYFVECIASCLSIDMLKDNKILGNATDKILFKEVDWCLEKIDEMWHDFHVRL